MSNGKPVLAHPFNQTTEIRCLCGKFLTKAVINIQAAGLGENELRAILRGLTVKYGAQTKCRYCKKLHEDTVHLNVA